MQILSNMIQRDAVVQSNRVRSYLHAAFQFGLKADNDPANMNKCVIFGLQLNPVSLIPRCRKPRREGWRELAEN